MVFFFFKNNVVNKNKPVAFANTCKRLNVYLNLVGKKGLQKDWQKKLAYWLAKLVGETSCYNQLAKPVGETGWKIGFTNLVGIICRFTKDNVAPMLQSWKDKVFTL
jgi:hypothetical protein